jgi:endonuclease YncB( thermonuclease family)
MKTAVTLIGLMLSLLTISSAKSDVIISGIVQTVLSGDQIIITHPELGQQAIRLAQIDAPELALGSCRAQAWSDIAQKALSQQVLGLNVQASCLERLDSEGFAVCQVAVDGENMNQWMLSQGHAWFDRSLGNNIWLQQLEQEAKRKRQGLWGNAANTQAPWAYKAQCQSARR